MNTLESKLKKALKSGDSEAVKQCCSEVFISYEKLVFYVANQILHNEQMARDALIETFVSFMSNLDAIKLDSIKYYLVQAAKQIAMRALFKGGNQIEFDDDIAIKETGEVNMQARVDAESALACLDEKEREIVIMKLEYGYKFKEIGLELGISENAASSKYTRSIKKMRMHLEERR